MWRSALLRAGGNWRVKAACTTHEQDVAPELDENRPAAHAVHTPVVPSRYWPAGHTMGEQLIAPVPKVVVPSAHVLYTHIPHTGAGPAQRSVA